MPNQKSRITKELDTKIDQIHILLKDGYSVSEISKKLGYGYSGVYNAIQRHGLGGYVSVKNVSRSARSYLNNQSKFTKEQLIEEYVNKKNNLYEIAAAYSMSPSNVLLYMRKYGIETRNKSEATQLIYDKRGDELREKHRQNAYAGITGVHMKGRTRKDSWIEKEFEQYCIDNGIRYEKQFQIKSKGHRYDFLIENSVIVELDGNYWHSTCKQKSLDRLHEELAKSDGYDIIRFTDIQIKQTKGKCFDELERYVGRTTLGIQESD